MKRKKHIACNNLCVKYALNRKKPITMKWKERNEELTTKDAWSVYEREGKQEQQNENNATRSHATRSVH